MVRLLDISHYVHIRPLYCMFLPRNALNARISVFENILIVLHFRRITKKLHFASRLGVFEAHLIIIIMVD